MVEAVYYNGVDLTSTITGDLPLGCTLVLKAMVKHNDIART